MTFVTNNAIFGQNLKYIRESNSFSPFYMAKLLNITEERLHRIEAGQDIEIDNLTVRILLNLLEEETADLFEKKNILKL